MKHIDEYRDGAPRPRHMPPRSPTRPCLAATISSWNSAAATRTPSRATASKTCFPPNVQMVHGPGCPVCVLPIGRIDDAIELAMRPEVTLCTYADLMRVPASAGANLLQGQGRRRRYPHGLFDAGRDPHRRGGTRPRSRVLRDRLRNDHAAHRTRHPARAQETASRISACFATMSSRRRRSAPSSTTPGTARRFGSMASLAPPMSAR